MNYDISILKNNIKELMKNQEPRLSQADLADIIGSTQSRVSKVLSDNGKDTFTLEQIIKLADYFKISIDDLLGREIDTEDACRTLEDVCNAFFVIDNVCKLDINIPPETPDSITLKINYRRINEFLKEWNDIRVLTQDNPTDHIQKLYSTWIRGIRETLSQFSTEIYSMSGIRRGSMKASQLLHDFEKLTLAMSKGTDIDEAELKSRHTKNDIKLIREYLYNQTPEETIDLPFCSFERSQQYTALENALDWLDGGLPFL